MVHGAEPQAQRGPRGAETGSRSEGAVSWAGSCPRSGGAEGEGSTCCQSRRRTQGLCVSSALDHPHCSSLLGLFSLYFNDVVLEKSDSDYSELL